MYKNSKTGYYEDDFRRDWLKRLHVSYGVRKRDEAGPLADAMKRIIREKRTELIELVRAGNVSVHEVAAAIADGRPLGDLGAKAASAALAWPTIERASTDYVEWLRNNDKKAAATAAAARSELNRFIATVGAETPVDQITTTRVLDYQRELYVAKYSQNSVVALMWRISGLYTWLGKREARAARDEQRTPRALHSPIDPEETTSRKTRRERFLTQPEAERLLAATPTALLAPVMLGLLAGLRVEEMLHLRPGFDIDLERKLITIQDQEDWQPKNRKRRVVPIAPQLHPVLEYHLAHYASERWLMPSPVFDDRPVTFESFSAHLARVIRDAEMIAGRRDPEGVVFHTLRHTFASWLAMKGVDLYTISKLLGNSLKVVEDTYAHLAPDFRQRAVDRLVGIVAIPALPIEGGAEVQ